LVIRAAIYKPRWQTRQLDDAMGKTLLKFLGTIALLCALSCTKAPQASSEIDPRIELSDQFSSDFELVDQNGNPFADESLLGKTAIVYFGFTTCPDVCPMALSRLSAAANQLKPKDREDLALVFVTVDPERDTPERLRAFLAFDPSIVGLTGPVEAAEHARQSFKVFAKKEILEGSVLGYTMNHSSLYYVVDPAGKPRLAINDSIAPDPLATILRQALKGRF
jgi:protein SCO1/2